MTVGPEDGQTRPLGGAAHLAALRAPRLTDVFTLRFDMRAPAGSAPPADLYAAAIEMCAWAETRGGVLAVLSEHHGTNDNHLPAPLILASAIASRTERLGIMLAAVVLPFCDPVRLAEEMSVLDIISGGRVSYVFGVGHRPEEYEQFGVDPGRRGRLADEHLALLERQPGERRQRDQRHIERRPHLHEEGHVVCEQRDREREGQRRGGGDPESVSRRDHAALGEVPRR